MKKVLDSTRRFMPILAITVLLFVVFSATQPGFLTWLNIVNLLTASSTLFVVSIGMTFVVLTAGADLSVAAVGAVTGIFLAKIIGDGVSGFPALLLTLLLGALIGGTINGILIGRLRMSFFVVTLASTTALTGAVNLWSGTQSFTVTSSVALDIGVNHYAGVPAPIWIMIGLLLVGLYLQHYTFLGRDVYSVGGSPIAAGLSGIRVSRVYISVYAISGFCAALGGVITVGRIGVASPTVDPTLPLQAIAAVLLGGTALSGGFGGVEGTVVGVVFIGILQNGLTISGVPSFWQQVGTGVILVAAVLGDRLELRRGWNRLRGADRGRSSAGTAASRSQLATSAPSGAGEGDADIAAGRGPDSDALRVTRPDSKL
jgi:ribose transport system permease protein